MLRNACKAPETYALFGDADPLQSVVFRDRKVVFLQDAEIVELDQPSHQVLRAIRRRVSVPRHEEHPLAACDHRHKGSWQGYARSLHAAARQEDELAVAGRYDNVTETLYANILAEGLNCRRAACSDTDNARVTTKVVRSLGV